LRNLELSARMASVMQKTAKDKGKAQISVEDLFQAGAHYGYGKSRRHPSASKYIYATKNKGDIIDLEKTSAMLEEALAYVAELGAKGKTILFVGTKPEAKVALERGAVELNMPYVTARWIGGTISNFTEIKKRIAELENYKKDSVDGGLDKYTKKERVVLAKKMERLAKYYTGLLGLKKAPDALFIIDPKAEKIAATEAQTYHIPIIGLANSDSNIKLVDYPIVGNDASLPSISLFIKAVVKAYKEGSEVASPKA